MSGIIPTATIEGTITITPSGIPVKVTTKLSLFATLLPRAASSVGSSPHLGPPSK